ncbi:Phosphoribosylglycinamide formyltransferase [Veillonella criceti]|uniref:Phosphoribosylglycinamide formyltransferase n=1 Tax=Veillonella criceti TaxID=103891 RepID=A0A380NNF9_9FIRM|nr:Phosphoribosylglycinamide formyltransferase [Veillonella criceti]
MTKRIAIFASGRGSNAAALYEAIQAGTIQAQVVVVLSDHQEVPVLGRAAEWGVPSVVVERKAYASKEAFEEAMLAAIAPYEPEAIVLAGYMRLLGPTFIKPYEHKILNIHPALLPSFPGLHAQGQAVAAGVKVSGCTVHFVDTGMDSGPIIMQAVVPVYADDTEDTLAARILPEEHKIYKKALALFCEDRLTIKNHIVHIED